MTTESNADLPLFSLRDVCFEVAGRNLLGPVTTFLPKGRVIGLIGQNGSGKSTLLKILARQQHASSGTVAFQGRPLAGWSGRAYARALAYLPQQPPAATGMLVRELVALGRYPWHGALGRFTRHDAEKVEAAIALTALTPLADRLVETLSGGERQRAWLAMLVAQDAECLLLDEPISALDVAHQMEVLDLVRSLSRERGLSVIIVLHDINMAARFCDELVALRAGSLIMEGKPGDVMTGPALQNIYGLEMLVNRHPKTGRPVAVPS